MDDLGIWRRGRCGASFDATAPVKVYVHKVGGNVDISWQAGTLL